VTRGGKTEERKGDMDEDVDVDIVCTFFADNSTLMNNATHYAIAVGIYIPSLIPPSNYFIDLVKDDGDLSEIHFYSFLQAVMLADINVS
jgi:hypothetical protein